MGSKGGVDACIDLLRGPSDEKRWGGWMWGGGGGEEFLRKKRSVFEWEGQPGALHWI